MSARIGVKWEFVKSIFLEMSPIGISSLDVNVDGTSVDDGGVATLVLLTLTAGVSVRN